MQQHALLTLQLCTLQTKLLLRLVVFAFLTCSTARAPRASAAYNVSKNRRSRFLKVSTCGCNKAADNDLVLAPTPLLETTIEAVGCCPYTSAAHTMHNNTMKEVPCAEAVQDKAVMANVDMWANTAMHSPAHHSRT